MPALRFALRNLRRDLKSGELAVLLLALLVAVALADRRRLLHRPHRPGGEPAGAARCSPPTCGSNRPRPIDESYDAEARRRGLAVARILSMPSVVFHGEASSLVALRAVGEGYPLRGRLKIADEPFGPARADRCASRRPARPGPTRDCWHGSACAVGATLAVGAHEVTVTQVLDYRPDQGAGFGDLSATLMINLADVPATELIQPGSRVSRAVLFAGDPRDVATFREYLGAAQAAAASGCRRSRTRARRSVRRPIVPDASCRSRAW